MSRRAVAKDRARLIRRRRARRALLPEVQGLERRQLLVAGALLQGTVFNDLNADGRPNVGEPYVSGAAVALYSADGSTLIAQAVTDANGYFRFDDGSVPGGDLQPGDYRVVETPPAGYQAGSARAITQLGAATALSPTTIQATVIDPANLTLTFDATYTGKNVTVQANGNPEATFAGGLGVTLKQAGATVASLVTNCIDLFHQVSGGNTFAVLPRPTATGFPANGGRIAYLFNHYGMDPATPTTQAAALQIALWELENDVTIDLGSGVFAANGVDPAVLSAANALLAESAGKNEAGVYLDATLGGQSVPTTGRQGMMAGGSLEFANTHPTSAPTAALSGRAYVDVNDDGRVGPAEPGLGGVTVVLSGVIDGGGVVTATTTTTRDGVYRFEHLQPGTYTLAETPPVGFIDAKDTPGDRGGTVGRKRFTGITLGQGVAAEGYNFGHERPPRFITDPILEVPLGATYVYAADATDPDGDALHYTLASGPTGSQLDGDTGRLQWTPTAADLGGHDVILRVADGRGGSADQHYTLNVIPNVVNHPPFFTSDPVVDANVATPYAYQATAFDPDFDALAFAIVAGPAGMAIADPSKGLITWTPTADQLGRQAVVVSVDDGHGHTTFQPYAVLVSPAAGNHPPVIVSDPTTVYRFPAWVSGSRIVGAVTIRDFPSDHRNPDFEQGVATNVVNGLVDKQLGLLQVDGGARRVDVSEIIDDNGMEGSYENQDPFRANLSFTTAGNDWTYDWSGYNYSQQLATGQPGADSATWKVVNTASGAFEIRATWAASSNLANDATYRIYDGATLLATVPVDQSQNPTGPTSNNAAFQSLGTYNFAGGTLRVVLSAPTGGTIAADAVQVVPATNLSWSGVTAPASAVAGSTITINRAYLVTGPASAADLVIAYYASPDAALGDGDDILLGSETITSAAGKEAGAHAGASPALRLPISGGTYHLFAVIDAGHAVVESDETDNAAEAAQTIAVSGAVVPAPTIIDNNDPGFTQTGYGWSTEYGYYDNGGYNSSVLTAPAGTGSNSAQWQTPNLPAGDYLVRATWTHAAGRATNAVYQIYDGATLIRTVTVDQTKAPLGPKFGQIDDGMGYEYGGALFQALATVHVTSGTLRVVLSDAADGTVVADAVRVQPSGPTDLNWNGGGVSGPLSAAPGSNLTVARAYNIDGTAVPADFTIAYYASSNGVLGDGDDYLLGSEVVTDAAGKAPGLHSGTSPMLRVPASGGPVYIFAVLDAGAAVTESDESDNVGYTRDRRPTYAGDNPNATAGGAINSVSSFNQWYRDTLEQFS